MSIYAKLREVLADHPSPVWKARFSEIEGLLGVKLPASAYKYPAWWSNNPSNNAMTKIWLMAGWRTEQVDIADQTVVFRRGEKPVIVERRGFRNRPRPWEGPPESWPRLETKSEGSPEENRAEAMRRRRRMEEMEEMSAGADFSPPKKKVRFEDLYGCMKGTIKIMPGVDATAPVYTPAEWAEIEAARDRKWDELLKPLEGEDVATFDLRNPKPHDKDRR